MSVVSSKFAEIEKVSSEIGLSGCAWYWALLRTEPLRCKLLVFHICEGQLDVLDSRMARGSSSSFSSCPCTVLLGLLAVACTRDGRVGQGQAGLHSCTCLCGQLS
eukprot:1137424-Pelagomonas_calceolata.AAC.5